MTYGEHLLSMSSLVSGSSAREHILDVSKPDTIYDGGEKRVLVHTSLTVSGNIDSLRTAGNILLQEPSGSILVDDVKANIIKKKIGED